MTGFSDFMRTRVEGDVDAADPAAAMLWHVGLAVAGGLVIVAGVGLLMWRKAKSAEY